MAFSSGTYTLYSPGNPVVSGTTISSTAFNSTMNDIATALSTCLLKDGTQTVTANIPMASFKFTGLGAGSANGNSLRYEQQFDANGYPFLGSIALTAAAGTNTVTATASPVPTAYGAGQRYILIPAATNTAATTLNISTLGAKSVFWNGAACSGGELVISVPALIEYDGTQFNIIGPMIGTRITNTLGGNVALNNIANYFDGPTCAQGTVGKWLAIGTVTCIDTTNTNDFYVKLWDGTSAPIASTAVRAALATRVTLSIAGIISSPVGNIRLSARSPTANTGQISFNDTGNSTDSTLTVVRIG